MSYTYRNTNTGDIHEADERDLRLDGLDNWELLKADGGICPSCGRGPELVNDGILSRKGMRPTEAFASAPVVRRDGDGAIERPADRAAKAVWIAYAVERGADPAEAEALTRDELVDQYGDESTPSK